MTTELGTHGQRVEEEKDRLAVAIAHVRAAVTLSDPRLPDQPLIYVNPAFTAITGYTAVEVVGRNCRFLQGPATDPAAVTRIRAAIAAGAALTIELLNYRKDGTPFWNELYISPVRNAQGEVHTYVGLQHDITARKQAEQTLRAEHESQVRAVTHSVREAVISADAQGTITFWSTGAQVIFGYTAEEALGRPLVSLLPSASRDAAATVLATVGVSDGPEMLGHALEATGLRRDGATFPLDVSLATSLRQGQTVVTAIVRDVSERRQAEERIRFQARLLDTVGQAVIATDLGGAILYWNKAAATLFGWTETEALGRSLSALTPLLATQQQATRSRAAIQAGQSWTGERLGQRRDGTTFPALVSDAPIVDDTGAVVGIIAVAADISDLKQAQDRLTYQALHDALTDLPNRALLTDRLEQAVRRSQRDGVSVALLLLDLRGFKEVNDALGHSAGDVLLQQVAQRIVATLRSSDTVARLGGDEFAAVLPQTDEAGAVQAVGKLLRALAEPLWVADQALSIEISVGIALSPAHGVETQTLVRRADIALYAARDAGDDYALYTPAYEQDGLARLTMMGELRTGIAQDQLLLHYQPILELATGRLVAVEALVRWQHPQRGRVQPDAFIPLAEQTGLIKPLCVWTLQGALRQARAWQDAGQALTVAVNVSTRNLHDPTLPAQVQELLRATGVAPAQLKLEITESALMADPRRALASLTGLAEMGVRLAIDDFGTGYSSLAYLTRLPVQELKIDKSFVLDLASGGANAIIVRSTIELGHNLGLAVIAEGVEDRATWDTLANFGCDFAQGYYIGRPMPAEDLAARSH